MLASAHGSASVEYLLDVAVSEFDPVTSTCSIEFNSINEEEVKDLQGEEKR